MTIMNPGQAWSAVSMILVLVVVVMDALFWYIGYDVLVIALASMIALLIYAYVLYKRFHVEVVTENDIALFDDTDDLRILSKIYGLDTDGDESELRRGLVRFVKGNSSKAFTWVAPRTVMMFGSTFELAGGPRVATTVQASNKDLVAGKKRSQARLSAIRECPVCDSAVSGEVSTCPECGADLEFYATLSEMKVGRRLLSQKNVAIRRKLRYDVPSIGER